MKSAFDGLNGWQIGQLSLEERQRRWAQDRKTVAEEWFGGDESRAEVALEALPYSRIPDWCDVDDVARLYREEATNA